MPDERNQANSAVAIRKLIGRVKNAGQKLNETIHNGALMCFQHALDYGDATLAAELVDALPLSHRRSLVINWFDQFSAIGINKDGKTGKMKGFLKGKADERNAMWNLEGAKATPFYAMPEAQREPDVPTFDSIHDNIVSFVKRMDKKVEQIADAEDQAKAQAEIDKLKQAVNG